MANRLAIEVGLALRIARTERGLRLRDVAVRSGGRFSATGVAGYERGERAISVVRFAELCELYGVRAGVVLGEALRRTQAAAETVAVTASDLAVLASALELASRGSHPAEDDELQTPLR